MKKVLETTMKTFLWFFTLACAQVKLSVLLIFASINRRVYCTFEHSQH